MLSSIFNVVVGLYSVIYVALKKTKEIAKTSVYAGIINIIVHLVLVKYIGLYAAPVSTIVAFGSMAVYRYFDLKKYLNVPLPMSVLLLVSGMFVLSCVSFYSKNTILQIVIFFVIAVVCVIANRSILMEAVRLILGKLNRLIPCGLLGATCRVHPLPGASAECGRVGFHLPCRGWQSRRSFLWKQTVPDKILLSWKGTALSGLPPGTPARCAGQARSSTGSPRLPRRSRGSPGLHIRAAHGTAA